MEISVSTIFVALWVIIGLQLAYIIFLYERIIKLKFFMGMNVGTKNQLNKQIQFNKKINEIVKDID